MAPMWFSAFLDNDSVARTRRDRRCLKVLLNRFDVVGCPRGFRDGFVTLRRDHAVVPVILVGVKGGLLGSDFGALRPQRLGPLPTPIAPMKRNTLAALGVHSEPNPWRVGLLLHEAPQFIGFGVKLINQDGARVGGEPESELIGTRCQACHPKAISGKDLPMLE